MRVLKILEAFQFHIAATAHQYDLIGAETMAGFTEQSIAMRGE